MNKILTRLLTLALLAMVSVSSAWADQTTRLRKVASGASLTMEDFIVTASNVDLTGSTAYWVRYTATDGLNLSTTAPTKGSDGWKSTQVSIVTANVSDLTQVFRFKKLDDGRILVYTQNADGSQQTYIGANEKTNQTWAMSALTLDSSTQPAATEQGFLREFVDATGTGNVFMKFGRNGNSGNVKSANETYLIANRCNYTGGPVYDDGNFSSKKNFLQWTIIEWKPLEFLKAEIDEVQALVNSAEVGTHPNQIKENDYKTVLETALATANDSYATIKTSIDNNTATLNSRLSDIQDALSTLRSAKQTYLESAYNFDPAKVYYLINKAGGVLKYDSQNPAVVNPVTVLTDDYKMKFTAESNGNYVLQAASNNFYLFPDKNKFTSTATSSNNDDSQMQDVPVKWNSTKEPTFNRCQFTLRHFDNDYVGIYFNNRLDYKSNGAEQTNEAYLHYDYNDGNAEAPYKLRGIKAEAFNNPSAQWVLFEQPVITIDETDKTASIDCAYPVYYTTDGTDPVTSETRQTYEKTFAIPTDTKKIRAAASYEDKVFCEAEMFVPYQPFMLKTTDAVNESYYMLPPLDATTTYVTTSNVPHERMQWLLKQAEHTGDNQYYYVVNAETGQYLYCIGEPDKDNSLVMMDGLDAADTEADRFKFCFKRGSYEVNDQTVEYYNITAKKHINAVKSCLKMRDGRGNDKHNVYIGMNQDETNGRSRWAVIPVPDVPATLSAVSFASTDETAQYFKLKSASDNTYVLLPPATITGYATAKTTGDNPEWMLEPAGTDDWHTYYYLRNGSTGWYLYFNGVTKNNNDNNFFVSEQVTAGNEDRFKFLVLKTANSTYASTGTWHIIPMLLKDDANQGQLALNRDNTKLRTIQSREANASCWVVSTDDVYEVAPPVINYNGETGKMSITCTTPGVRIYYTYGLALADEPTATSTEYAGGADGIDLPASSYYVRAVAVKDGKTSAEATPLNLLLSTIAKPRPFLIQSMEYDYYYLVPNLASESDKIALSDGSSAEFQKLTTTSLPRPSMMWRFEDAGIGTSGLASGKQLLYLVNHTTGQYVYFHSYNVSKDGVETVVHSLSCSNNLGSDKVPYQFWIENSTSGDYLICHDGGESNPFVLYKGGSGNKTDWNIGPSMEDADKSFARWSFVYVPDEKMPAATAPVTGSEGDVIKFYKIGNEKYPDQLIEAATPLTTNTTESVSTAWYFVEADHDDWLTYYNIVNADGQYIYLNSAAANANLSMVSAPASNDAYQFALAKATTGNLYIVPRQMKYNGAKTYYSLYADGTNPIQILNRRGGEDSDDANDAFIKWILSETTVKCKTPEITYDAKTDGYVITTDRPGEKLYYTITIGGSTSTPALYTESIRMSQLEAGVVITAYAIREGETDTQSDNATLTIEQVARPVIAVGQKSVRLASSTKDATIYYTIDGTTPTTNSTKYVSPLTDVIGKTLKAIAVKGGYIDSEVTICENVSYMCDAPVIKKASDTSFTLTCSYPSEGVVIYYTIDGNEPTTSSSHVNSGETVTGVNLPLTVKAMAVAPGYSNSSVAEKVLNSGLGGSGTEEAPYLIDSDHDYTTFVEMVNGDDAGRHYILTSDVSASAEITKPFTGVFDGDYHTISGLSHALFEKVSGGTVKNVALKGVNISGGTNVGAICNEADGATKIYNCGILPNTVTRNDSGELTWTAGSVSGSGAVGGLVGHIASSSSVRVVNCYNYATVSGGTYAGGIVGQNEGNVDGTTSLTGSGVRITNCMMYGDMTNGTNRSPVYAGNHTDNKQKFTEYNYYRSRADLTYTAYNEQLAIDKDDYLTRFPFYRHIQNTHRELASYFLYNDYDHVEEISHWGLNTEVAPYPIIEAWETNTHKVRDAQEPTATEKYAGKMLTEMGNSGRLGLTVIINGLTYSASLPITDMDTLRYDYTWGKVVLPFANEFGNKAGEPAWTRDYTKICTGWKITSVGGESSFKTPATEPYNFADRDNPQKDIYDATNNPYIFAQGGNYIVPYGVTEITIEANFANAYYLSDEYYDYGYNNEYKGQTSLGGKVQTTYHGQKVYTSLNDLVEKLDKTTNPNDQAIVLVGNFHYNMLTISGGKCFATDKAVTIMSVDEDCNQEPDYGWYSYHNGYSGRPDVPPLRFDFVPNIGIGMAARVTGSKAYPSIGIWHCHGWFELTETCVSLMSECEINSTSFNANDNGNGNNRWVLNSGYFLQIIRGYDGDDNKLSYVQIGGNAYVEQYYPSSHIKQTKTTTLRPTVVTGGEVVDCFMTGNHHNASGSDVYFWCAGGKIHKYLSAFTTVPTTAGVNVTAKVDHALISRFFGGGTSAAARITGNIDITMDNSKVDFYCGGPEFGDMVTGTNGKTVTTHATGTTFGEYYGAGFGGTSLTTVYTTESSGDIGFGNATLTFPLEWNNYKYLQTNSSNGLGVGYAFDYILYSGGDGQGVARFYNKYARFSLATTGNVTNVLKNCTVKGSFYGAGCQGKVDGTVTSTLTGCTIEGDVFGGGYKAENNTLDVYPNTQPTYSVYTKETGLFSDFGTIEPETWKWEAGTVDTYEESTKTLRTDVDLTTLGNVTGAITITLDGTTVARDVFGGGNESKSLNNTTVTIKGGSHVTGDVFGGGNKGNVGGSTTVNIEE